MLNGPNRRRQPQQRMQLFDLAKVYSAAFSARYAWSEEEAVTHLLKLEEAARIQEAKSGNDLEGCEIFTGFHLFEKHHGLLCAAKGRGCGPP